MKIKELQKTVNISWSPAQQDPIYLAAGSAAQQLDTTGNTSVLEIYSTNFKDPSLDLELKATQSAPYKFQKVLWAPTNFGTTHPNGLIVGGCESGHLMVYSASKMLAGEEGLIASQAKHTGSIRGLDYNPFQGNLLASCASESEILIWDLNNTTTPMAPGTKSQPLEDIQNVSWNRQVQHILASVFSTRCVIWDLRKNEQIIKLSDNQSRVRWRAMQWHPEIATQLWLASEDDQSPVVQLWDLRYATTPSKSYQIHNRGILGLGWCTNDIDIMASCGKDNKIYCWNPNTEIPEGEILSEVATTQQWYSDVQWCPRNSAYLASSSLDGTVSIYSLFGGTQQQVQTSNKIADSFPGMDQISQAPAPQQTSCVQYMDLKRPPKWMKKHSGVSFGFGGKLLVYNQDQPKVVSIKQVITEPELVQRANALETTLQGGNYADYCREKADQMPDQHGRFLWYFLKAGFELNPREEMLNLLGYNKDDVSAKFQKYLPVENGNIENVTNRMAGLTHNAENSSYEASFPGGNSVLEVKSKSTLKIPSGDSVDALITEAIISGNIEAAIEICFEERKFAEALIIASTRGIDLLTKTQSRYLSSQSSELSQIINALVNQDWVDLTSQCTIDSWKEALVAALTHGDGEYYKICSRLGDRLQSVENNPNLAKNSILCYISSGNLEKLVDGWLNLKKIDSGNQDFKPSTKDLQELVEIVMLLKKSLELRGTHISPSGKLAEFLTQYAGLLVAQGALDSALEYLGPTEDEHLEDLRERLYYALGHKQQTSTHHVPQPQQTNTNRFNQQRGSFSTGHVATPPVPQQWNAMPQPVPTAQPPVSMFTPAPSAALPPKPPSVTENMAHPPRPGSTGLPRAKYVLDPSVSSNNPMGYGQSMPPAPMNNHGYGQQVVNNQPTPMQFNQTGFNMNAVSAPNPLPYQPPQAAPMNNYMPGVPPIETMQPPPAMAHTQPLARNPTPPPGWNDPPAFMTSRAQKKNDTTAPSATSAPITHPLFGVDPNQNQNGYYDPNSQYQNQQFAQPPTPQQMYNPVQQNNNQYPNVMNFQTQATSQPIQQQPPQQNTYHRTSQAEVAKEKLPLPEEYVYLQTVLEELKTQCLNIAQDARTKRKFVDVSKRLESLYDALREGRLSANTLSALNQIVQYIQIGDYGNALAAHTSIVSGPDFAQTASFMPGIKVLVQSAADLHVYLR